MRLSAVPLSLLGVAILSTGCSQGAPVLEPGAGDNPAGQSSSKEAASTDVGPAPPEARSEEAPDRPLTYEERVWRHRLEAAFAPYECPAAPAVAIPRGSYAGKLIDSHFHMAHLPDSPPGAESGERDL